MLVGIVVLGGAIAAWAGFWYLVLLGLRVPALRAGALIAAGLGQLFVAVVAGAAFAAGG